ncbi:hypothetical protein [Terrarubrum flagellatum]|uniref:hypothetical protein n=1 Tax=Terrirubrum flagellatum TaxID=2895980 RepID=UPI003144ED96
MFLCLMKARCAAAALCVATIFISSARADDISAASIGLRGGYDSNPANIEGGKGSAFVTQFASWDFLRGSDKDGYGVTLNAAATFYDPRVLAAALNNAATFRHAVALGDNLLLRSTLSATQEQTWSRRQNALTWRERLDYERGQLRLFLSADTKLTSLNERNIFALGGFLPSDENFATLTLLPGIAWRTGETEIGVSFAASRTRYLEEFDYIGLRRRNDRWQPNLFASTLLWGAKLEGSLSAFNAKFPDRDFEGVRRILYTAKLTAPIDRVTLTASSGRSAEDTTLPFSVINISTSHEARASLRIDDKSSFDLFARRKTDDYVGLDAKSTTLTAGAEYQRVIAKDLTALLAGSWRRTQETGAPVVDAFNLQIGLQTRFDIAGAKPAS